MIGDKIQRLLQKESFYIFFSIIASVALWAYVEFSENPDVIAKANNIPIQFINEEALTKEGLILTGIDKESISLQFSGKRNNVGKLSGSNVQLTVNLMDILDSGGVPGVYQLSYKIIYPSSVNVSGIGVAERSAGYVTVTVENLVSVEVFVKGSYDGGVDEGYSAEPIEFYPEKITVSGPEALVKEVSYAWVAVQGDSISETLEIETPVILMDSYGKVVSSDKLTLSEDVIKVKIPVLVVKDVALSVNFIYGASATKDNVICTISPSSVTLSGEAEILDGINKLIIGTIDLMSFSETNAEPMQIVIPNSVENVTGVTTAIVSVQVRGVDIAKAVTTNIQVKNETLGYTSTILTQSLEITLRGTGGSEDLVKPENIRVVADLAELGESAGTFSVPAKVFVDGSTTVDVIGAYKVTVVVEK